jgi:hypothetical protein
MSIPTLKLALGSIQHSIQCVYSADVSFHRNLASQYLMLCNHVSSSTVLGILRLLHFLLNVMEGCSQTLHC